MSVTKEDGAMSEQSKPLSHPSQRRYPPELRERATRMVLEAKASGERYGAVSRVARQLGIEPETLRHWAARAEVERENRELRRANEILKAAAAFFGAELDRPRKR